MVEEYHHRDYRAVLYPEREGWRVEVYAPGSEVCEAVISYAGAPTSRDIVVDDIVQIIDARS